jgi:hypothetical protein
MCKTPTRTNAQAKSGTIKKGLSSNSTIDRTNNGRSRSPIRKSRTAARVRTRDSTKKNSNTNEPSSGATSDISNDEMEQDQPSTKSSNGNRRSAVHEFASKMSENEYQCKICLKVRIFTLSFYI